MARQRRHDPEQYNKPFPTRFREVMDAQGKKQQEVAAALHKSRQTIGYYRDGIASPDLETASLIAEYFGVSVDYLLGVTNIKAIDPDTRTICGKLGLSETVVKWLEEGLEREGPERYGPFDHGLNSFLEHPRAFDFFKALAETNATAKTVSNIWDSLSPEMRAGCHRDFMFQLFLVKELAGEIIDEISGKHILTGGGTNGNDHQA